MTFPLLRLRLEIESQGMRLDESSGSLWHGGLGMMLKRQFPNAFDLLYGGSDDARLYAIQPPPPGKYPPGSTLTLELRLFGPAVAHALACTQAIATGGSNGLGPAGQFALRRAGSVQPAATVDYYTTDAGLICAPAALQVSDWLEPAHEGEAVTVRLLTPLRLKEGNDLLRAAPEYTQLIKRLFGRLDQIAHASGVAAPLPKLEREPLLAAARNVTRATAAIRWQDMARRSGRTGQQMSFGGLLGSVAYAGPITETLPWLAAGRWLQLGGKTAFGFGCYDLAIGPG